FESGPKKHYESEEHNYEGIPKDYHEDVRKLIDNEKLEIDDIKSEYDIHKEHGNYFIEKLINSDEVPSGYPKEIPIETKYLIEGKQQSTREKQPIKQRKEQQSTRREQEKRI